jgi:hypothetical protein
MVNADSDHTTWSVRTNLGDAAAYTALTASIICCHRCAVGHGGGVEADPLDDIAVAAVQFRGDPFRIGDDGERVEHVVVDQSPISPTCPACDRVLSVVLQTAPAVELEHRR